VIFVDTSFWVALRLRRDARHSAAAGLWREHANAGLVTTEMVRGETWTFLRRRAGHAAAVDFLDALERSERVTMLPLPSETDATALRWLRQRDDREYSYVDATSFIAMRARRIGEALAFDGDFAAAGFVELRPQHP
jgi:uncharacterized protein